MLSYTAIACSIVSHDSFNQDMATQKQFSLPEESRLFLESQPGSDIMHFLVEKFKGFRSADLFHVKHPEDKKCRLLKKVKDFLYWDLIYLFQSPMD